MEMKMKNRYGSSFAACTNGLILIFKVKTNTQNDIQ